MKTIFKSAIVALALAVSVSTSAAGYQFTRNLTIGARGADVTALQDFLTATGYYSFAGGSTGYFGPVTRSAVSAYQAAKGIMPTAGYFGPATRASVNANDTVNTGTPTTSTTPGCTAGAMFSSTTGAPCVTTTNPSTPVLNGMEGFGEYRLGTQPVDNTNITSMTDVPVYSVEVKAKNADISMERLTLDVGVSTVNGTENPSTLINSISVKDGSTVLATIPVNSSTFSRYSSSNKYYIQISGLSTRVAKDTIKTFTVHFNTNSIDINRDVTINADINGVRVVDGRGISTYNSSAVGQRAHTFKKAGAATLTLQSDANLIYSTNYKVDVNNGAREALTSTFALKSTSGPSKLRTVTANVGTMNGNVSNIYLFQGSTLLSSRSLSGTTTAIFDIDSSNVVVNEDQTTTFSIKVDVPSSATSTVASTTVTYVTFDKSDGSSGFASGSVSGPNHFFAKIVPVFAKVSSEITLPIEDGKVQSVAPIFVVDITPTGGSLSTTTKATIALVNASGGVIASQEVVGALSDSGLTNLAEGSVRRVTYAYGFASSTVTSGVNYKAVITGIKWTPTGGSEVNQTNSFSGLDTSFRVR